MARALGRQMAQHGNVDGVCLSIKICGGWTMDIPNDLNKLLAQLKQVTSDARSHARASSGSRPTAAEIDLFLSQRNFEPGAVIEQIEISNEGVFECYLFSVSTESNNGLSLLTMRADQSLPSDSGEPFQSSQ
jgi:hypothetical protein